MRLVDLPLKRKAKIISVNCGEKTRKKLAKMGVINGVDVIVVRRAPLKDPLEINVKDFYLAIRKCDAFNIEVALYD